MVRNSVSFLSVRFFEGELYVNVFGVQTFKLTAKCMKSNVLGRKNKHNSSLYLVIILLYLHSKRTTQQLDQKRFHEPYNLCHIYMFTAEASDFQLVVPSVAPNLQAGLLIIPKILAKNEKSTRFSIDYALSVQVEDFFYTGSP